VASTFAARERGRVIGLLNAAPNLAAMLTPLVVSLLYPLVGWTGTVVIIGASGFACAAAWLLAPVRRPSPALPDQAGPAPQADAPADRRLLVRMAAAFAGSKLLTDPVWWFMLFWLPDLLHRRWGLDTAHLGLPVAAVYACAGVGSLVGGFLPHRLARQADKPERARRAVMLVAAACVLPIPLLLFAPSLAAGVALAGLALGAHQVFASNLFGFVAERVPGSHVGRVSSAGAFCGNLGGALMLRLAGGAAGGGGHGLLPVFGYCALAYLAAWILFNALVPLRRLR
jgi:MFS transporter, ACS family, hexuronate transporter